MNILHTSESLLPQLKLYGHVQLLKTGLKMTLEGIGIVEVDSMHLCRVFGSSLDMVSEQLAQPAEFGLAGVLLAKLKGLHGSALVHDLQARIVSEDVEDGSVCLPEELEGWSDDGAVGTVLVQLGRNGREKDGLGGLAVLQVVHVRGRIVCLFLCLLHLLLGEIDELLQHQLDCADVGVLGDILVLVEGVLGQLSLLLFYGLLDQEEHNRLQGHDGDISRSLGGNMFVEEDESSLLLPNAHEFVSALEHILGLLGWRRRHDGGVRPGEAIIWQVKLRRVAGGGEEEEEGRWVVEMQQRFLVWDISDFGKQNQFLRRNPVSEPVCLNLGRKWPSVLARLAWFAEREIRKIGGNIEAPCAGIHWEIQ